MTHIEAWSGVILIAWAVWVDRDGAKFSEIPAYAAISKYIPDTAWAYTAAAIGSVQVVAFVLSLDWIRILGCFSAMVLFKILAVSILVSSEPGPNSLVLCGLAFANMAATILLFTDRIRRLRS